MPGCLVCGWGCGAASMGSSRGLALSLSWKEDACVELSRGTKARRIHVRKGWPMSGGPGMGANPASAWV